MWLEKYNPDCKLDCKPEALIIYNSSLKKLVLWRLLLQLKLHYCLIRRRFSFSRSRSSTRIVNAMVNATAWNRFHVLLYFLDKRDIEHENVALRVALHVALGMAWPSANALDSWFLFASYRFVNVIDDDNR